MERSNFLSGNKVRRTIGSLSARSGVFTSFALYHLGIENILLFMFTLAGADGISYSEVSLKVQSAARNKLFKQRARLLSQRK